jgi:tetratricopeptide (TPR) repeat protein
MLILFGVPTWKSPDQADVPLPASLPACLLLYLACHGQWLEREALASVFWPERSPEEARHNLRVNLHRVRQMLAERELGAALQSERSRVWLQLPTDVGALRSAMAAKDGAALGQFAPVAWLSSFRVPGFAGFFEWADALVAQLRWDWRIAAEQSLQAATREANDSPWTSALRATFKTLAATTGELVGPNLAEVNPTVLVGRSHVLQTLRHLQFRAVLLTGEAGMGKTALLQGAFGEVPILYGREGLTQIPYRAVVECLQSNFPTLRARLRYGNDELAAYRLDLARLLPQLAPNEALPPLDMHTAKARLLEALARVFEGMSPWLLVDDLQWCDSASLELLALLTHRGVLRWRAGARAYELTETQREWLSGLERSGYLHQVALPGLESHEILALCQQYRPDVVWQAEQVQRLHSLSGGNPFSLVELLKSERSALVGSGESDYRNPPTPVRDMLQRRLKVLAPAARLLVEAASIFEQPMPLGVLTQMADVPHDQHLSASRLALESDLLREATGGLACRHDLVRYAVLASLSESHQQVLHRKAALAMAARAEGEAEPLAVAGHWSAAQEPQTALAWMLRGAEQLKRRGQFEEARSLWGRVALESLDATQALQARLALAESELLTNLGAGRQALELILEQIPAVAEPVQREHIQAQTLSGLVDNLVFAGDMASARHHAAQLRPLLPRLRAEVRVHACEVLIELAMREPDIAAAWSLLSQIRLLAPNNPSTLSFEGQIHWFSGSVLKARDAFEALLTLHPAYCSGLTIENDLAVMLFALGDLARAETMARRSLVSWAGVAHTESLSLLVLGSILTSAGRYTEGLEALNRAHQLGMEQGSALFVAEAQVRRARLQMQCGHYENALQDLDQADTALHGSSDPLRVSQFAVVRLDCQIAAGLDPDRTLVERTQALTDCSSHPVMLARLARMQAVLALADGQMELAAQAAQRQADTAQRAGLQEHLADALLLLASATSFGRERERLIGDALRQAEAQGFADLAWRALSGSGVPAGSWSSALLFGYPQTPGFDALQAQKRAPWLAKP